MGILVLVLVILALLLGFPAGAQADVIRFPGQRPADPDPWLQAIVTASDTYWAARGHPGCGPLAVDVADTLWSEHDHVDAVERGWPPESGECRIALDKPWLDHMLGQARRPWHKWRRGVRLRLQRGPVADLCGIVLHGVGHTRGLEHTASGVMAAGGAEAPDYCRRLARRLIPRSSLT